MSSLFAPSLLKAPSLGQESKATVKNRWFGDLFPTLTEEEMRKFGHIVDLMVDKLFIPIIEAEDKESAIKEKLDLYNYYLDLYLNLAFTTISHKMINQHKLFELLLKFYECLREEVKEKVSNRYTRILLFKVINILEEHDTYTAKLLTNFDELVFLIDSVGAREYFHAFRTTWLALTVVLLSLDIKSEAIRSLSLIAKKYADELEPFVANFQISI